MKTEQNYGDIFTIPFSNKKIRSTLLQRLLSRKTKKAILCANFSTIIFLSCIGAGVAEEEHVYDGFSENGNGGVFAVDNNYSFESYVFTNNSVTGSNTDNIGRGGAVYIDNAGIVEITNTVFFNNTAENRGGAIYNLGKINSMSNVNFLSNASISGGAIFNENEIGDLSNIKFIDNAATATVSSSGGAIYNYSSKIGVLNEVSFIGNTASSSGGAIYNSGTIGTGEKSVIALKDVDFIGNTSLSLSSTYTANGGAIYNSSNGKIGALSNVNFIGNTALGLYSNGFGGAIVNLGTIGDLTYVNFIGNKSSMLGGVIYNSTGVIGDLSNVNFIGNTSFYAGGAINNVSNGVIGDLSNVNFIGNTSETYMGGAIYNASGGKIGDLSNVNFIDNVADRGGALYNNSGGIIGNLSNVNFINNTAGYNGSALMNQNIIGTLNNVNFIGNKLESLGSYTSGGALFNGNVKIETLININFIANTSVGGGSAIYNGGIIENLNNVNFIGNISAGDGGAIHSARTMTISSGFFSGNLSGAAGTEKANSIHNVATSGTINITPGKNELLDMRDPMSGGLSNRIIIKQGVGVWKLGGNNELSVTNGSLNIEEGTLYLYRAGEVVNGNSLDQTAKVEAGKINLIGTGSNFTLGTDTKLFNRFIQEI